MKCAHDPINFSNELQILQFSSELFTVQVLGSLNNLPKLTSLRNIKKNVPDFLAQGGNVSCPFLPDNKNCLQIPSPLQELESDFLSGVSGMFYTHPRHFVRSGLLGEVL